MVANFAKFDIGTLRFTQQGRHPESASRRGAAKAEGLAPWNKIPKPERVEAAIYSTGLAQSKTLRAIRTPPANTLRLGLRRSSAALRQLPCGGIAAEGYRSPKPRGIIQPAFRCGHSFC